jgi:hypothetical protein
MMKPVTREHMSVASDHDHDFSVFIVAPTKKMFFGLLTVVRRECAMCRICGELVIQRYDLPLDRDQRNRLGLFKAERRKITLTEGFFGAASRESC